MYEKITEVMSMGGDGDKDSECSVCDRKKCIVFCHDCKSKMNGTRVRKPCAMHPRQIWTMDLAACLTCKSKNIVELGAWTDIDNIPEFRMDLTASPPSVAAVTASTSSSGLGSAEDVSLALDELRLVLARKPTGRTCRVVLPPITESEEQEELKALPLDDYGFSPEVSFMSVVEPTLKAAFSHSSVEVTPLSESLNLPECTKKWLVNRSCRIVVPPFLRASSSSELTTHANPPATAPTSPTTTAPEKASQNTSAPSMDVPDSSALTRAIDKVPAPIGNRNGGRKKSRIVLPKGLKKPKCICERSVEYVTCLDCKSTHASIRKYIPCGVHPYMTDGMKFCSECRATGDKLVEMPKDF